MKRYRAWTPEQSYLLPPSPADWLPEGHLAYFMLELVHELDLSEIESVLQSKDARGTRSYAPRMMTALILYAYSVGVYSSRKIERGTYEDVAFRVLGGGEHPHFSTVSDFRLQHREALAGLFMQVLKLCRRAGLVSLGHVSLDGSKVQANASKHKAMSYGRMKEEEKRLGAEIEAILFRADEVDRDEDERYGRGQRPEDLPEELRRRETRVKRIREAKAELEKEASDARATQLVAGADDENGPDDEGPPSGATASSELPHHRVRSTPDGKPVDKAQRNFTDPDSRIMVKNGTYLQGYNAQVIVDQDHQIIVAEAVSNQAPDVQHLSPMLERVVANCGEAPDVITADTGYFSIKNVERCHELHVEPYIAVQRKVELAGGGKAMTEYQCAKEAMRRKLLAEPGRALYARRKAIVEPVFGQIKQARGFRRFSLRGMLKARAEWSIVCLTHNILKLYRALGRLPEANVA